MCAYLHVPEDPPDCAPRSVLKRWVLLGQALQGLNTDVSSIALLCFGADESS